MYKDNLGNRYTEAELTKKLDSMYGGTDTKYVITSKGVIFFKIA